MVRNMKFKECVCVVYIGVKEQNDEKSRKVEYSYTQHTYLTDYELPLVINFISL